MLKTIRQSTSGAQALLALLLVLLATEIAWILTEAPLFAYASRTVLCVLCLLGAPFFTIREVSLVAFALVSTALVYTLSGDQAAILDALDLATFFAAFIWTLTAMRDVAARSGSILAVGRYLILQPPGRRFFATALGGHFMGVFLNFGAVSLMAPMIQSTNPGPALERRQISALIRGFSWVILWAPTTLTQVVLLTIFTDITWPEAAIMGLGTAALFILVGRLYDRWEWRHEPPHSGGQTLPLPRRAVLVVSGICTAMIGATIIGNIAFDFSIAQALLFIAPTTTWAWFLAQKPPSLGTMGHRTSALFTTLTPSAVALARSAVALGVAGYLGRLIGQTLPMDQIAEGVRLATWPGWLFLAVLPVLINLGGQIALSPILIVVLLGEVFRNAAALPVGHAEIYFALSVGWALSMTMSPNATATLLISAASRIPATTLTWRWNLRYGLICYAIAVGIFALIA